MPRESRHSGLAPGLDSTKHTSIDIDVRKLTDYLVMKNLGMYGLPRDLHWIYSIFDPNATQRLKPGEFGIVTKEGAMGLGTFDLPDWHKRMGRFGRSKDGKHSRPLVGMGVLTSEENIPLAQVVFPGNWHDKTVFERALPSLMSLVEEITSEPKKITFIFDTGCNDEGLIKVIEKTPHCVGRLKRNQVPADLLRVPVEDLDPLYETEEGYEVRGLRAEGDVFGKRRTLAVRWHEGTAKRKRRSLKYFKEKALKRCQNLKKRMEDRKRGRKFTRKGVQDRVRSLGG